MNQQEKESLLCSLYDASFHYGVNALHHELSTLSRDVKKSEKARELHHRLFPLFNACFVESNPVPAKAALSLLGLMRAEVRLPLSTASDSTFALMERTLRDLQLL